MNKKHDISGGIDLSGGKLETFRIIFYSILGWFTITIEAFLRFDFGERYYTKVNFFIGLSVLTWVNLFGGISIAFSGGYSSWLFILWLGYLGFSLFHFWKIWVNNQTGNPQHSFYGGASRLEPLGRLLIKLLNPLLVRLVRVFGKLALKKEKIKLLEESLNFAPVIRDLEAFTKKWVEPVTLFLLAVLAWNFSQIFLGIWLITCSMALFLHTHMAYDNARGLELDMNDSMIDAAFTIEDKQGQEMQRMQMREALEVVEKRVKEEPEFVENLQTNNPSILEALADLNPNLKNIGKEEGAE